jgi:hypothetical protein
MRGEEELARVYSLIMEDSTMYFIHTVEFIKVLYTE